MTNLVKSRKDVQNDLKPMPLTFFENGIRQPKLGSLVQFRVFRLGRPTRRPRDRRSRASPSVSRPVTSHVAYRHVSAHLEVPNRGRAMFSYHKMSYITLRQCTS